MYFHFFYKCTDWVLQGITSRWKDFNHCQFWMNSKYNYKWLKIRINEYLKLSSSSCVNVQIRADLIKDFKNNIRQDWRTSLIYCFKLNCEVVIFQFLRHFGTFTRPFWSFYDFTRGEEGLCCRHRACWFHEAAVPFWCCSTSWIRSSWGRCATRPLFPSQRGRSDPSSRSRESCILPGRISLSEMESAEHTILSQQIICCVSNPIRHFKSTFYYISKRAIFKRLN